MLWKSAFILAWTLGLFGARIALSPVRVAAPDRERRARRALFRFWARGVLWSIGARLKVRGVAPAAPYFLVSNHVSYLDVIVYAAVLGSVFVAMAEIGAWPLIGWLARGMNTLFVDRSRRRDTTRVNEEIAAALKSREGIVIFPEGTTSVGRRVLPFKASLLQPAVAMPCPIHLATIRYATPAQCSPASCAICWVDDTPFLKHAIRMLRLPGFEVTLTFGDTPVLGSDRKRLAAALRDAIEARLDPME
jgi:1-acyl-sn-glycerol-3-phosphate acyltransferase